MLHPADTTYSRNYIHKNNKALPAPHHQSARRGMCRHTRADSKYMCLHTAICVSSYYSVCVLRGLCPHTPAHTKYVCIKYARPHATVHPHTTVYIVHMYASDMCPHTAIYAICDM